jgi:hypothetical protein
MTAPDPVEISVNNQCWGVGGPAPAGAPANAPADAVQLYQGADAAKNGFKSWWAWDIRSILLKLGWDLLRFQPIGTGKPAPGWDRTLPVGLRDTITRTWYLADQNNQILQALAAAAKVDITAILAE